MNVVLDTNVLVSALWSPGRKPGDIVSAVLAGRLTACYDHRILDEYDRVLRRPKFAFSGWQIDYLLEPIIKNGLSVIADPLPDVTFADELDRKFFEVARFCGATLITGNIRHYPPDPCVYSVTAFHERYL